MLYAIVASSTIAVFEDSFTLAIAAACCVRLHDGRPGEFLKELIGP